MIHHAKMLIRFVSLATALAAASSAVAASPDLADVLKKPAYRSALTQILKGMKPVPPWLTTFLRNWDGVVAPGEPVTVGGGTYEAYSVCKPHDCDSNRMEVIYKLGGRQAWGILIVNAGSPIYLGAPDAAMTDALNQYLN